MWRGEGYNKKRRVQIAPTYAANNPHSLPACGQCKDLQLACNSTPPLPLSPCVPISPLYNFLCASHVPYTAQCHISPYVSIPMSCPFKYKLSQKLKYRYGLRNRFQEPSLEQSYIGWRAGTTNLTLCLLCS
jgi:hypothetical protein